MPMPGTFRMTGSAAAAHSSHARRSERTNDIVEAVAVDALFVMINREPHTHLLHAGVGRDAQGYLLTGRDLLEQSQVPLETSP
jgi:thioredoxin reductase (NADPH)